jgi:hypothetical protein
MTRKLAAVLLASLALLSGLRFFSGKRPLEVEQPVDAPVMSAKGSDGSFQPTPLSFTPTTQTEQPFGARIARLLHDDAARESFKLSPIELTDYLARNQTNASSLLVAFETTHDREYIRQAAEAFPDDPFVQSKVLFHNVFPEQRGEWIERMKQSAPDNSLPHLLAAQELMKRGDATGALAEIVAGRTKKLDDYTRETMAGLEEAYVLAGRPLAESKAMGSSEILLPQLAPFKKLAIDLRDTAEKYGQAGDGPGQAALLEAGWIMGSQLRESGQRGALLNELVGLAVENISLQYWPENVDASFVNRPVSDQLASNGEFRKQVKTGSATWNQWLPNAPENEVIAFYDRLRLFGERNAMEWLMRQHPEFAPQGTLVSER